MLYEQTTKKHCWTDNGRFLVKRCKIQNLITRFNRVPLTPEQFDQHYNFTSAEHVKQQALRRYRTYGMYFHSGSIVYARTIENTKSGLSRLFEARPDEFILQRNQLNFCQIGRRRHRACVTQMMKIIQTHILQNLPVEEFTSTRDFANTPHPKKELRRKAFLQIMETGILTKKTYADEVKAKVKIETAKTGKNARIYVDMTTPQSLLGGWLIEAVKDAMNVIDLGWCVFKFTGHTDETSVKESFQFLRDNAHRPCMVYHSDDAIVSIPCSNGPLIFNLDISSCDRSNTRAIFSLLEMFIPEPYRDYFKRIVAGASLPIRVPNPEVKGEYFLAQPTQPFEYSGINITTLLNNVASLMIGLSIFYRHNQRWTKEECARRIPDRVRTAGYIVTVQVCKLFEELQFLKFSPSCIEECLPVRNLGCILRAIGHADGDFPGRGKLLPRIHNHISSVICGITTGYVDPISYKLRQKWVKQETKPKHVKYQYSLAGWTSAVGYQHLTRRYGLSSSELAELEDLVLRAGIGDIVSSPVLSKVFELDYSTTPFTDYLPGQ